MLFRSGYSAVAEVTGASVENMGLVHRLDSDLAIALADTVHQAYNGGDRFNGNKLDVLAIASLYPNAVQIVTLADSGITSLTSGWQTCVRRRARQRYRS